MPGHNKEKKNHCLVLRASSPCRACSFKIKSFVIFAGLGQLSLIAVVYFIPRILNWSEQLQNVRNLTRQIFWTYAGYIFTTNTVMGLISVFGASLLLDQTPLATLVCAYIFTYWTARLILQFTYYDRSDAPDLPFVKLGEAYIVALFIFLSAVYGTALYFNVQGLTA